MSKTGKGRSTKAPSPAASRPDGRHGAPHPRKPRRTPLIMASIAVLLVLCAAGAWFLFGRTPAVAFARTSDQNVLLITIDTLRADALSCYGGRAATPNLDRLAAMGVRFDFAHSHAVVTLPSHASILTGRYPFETGVHDNAGFRLPATIPTLAGMLKAKGMATAAFIAAFALDSRFGLNRGFDVYDEHYGTSNTVSGIRMPERRADAVVAAATTWIAAQKGRWFAWVHLYDPHAPYQPPPPFDRQYAGQPYYGEVAFADSALARLFDAARDVSGRPTFIVVTGDHGEGLGDHGELTHGLFTYEATLHIPLILAQITESTPAWGAGAASAAPGPGSPVEARHVDVVPTVFDALGLPLPAGLPGRSLLPGSSSGSERGASYFEALSASLNRGWAPLTGVLMDRDKYIDLPIPELYDLAHDAKETDNLAGHQPERVRTLDNRLHAFRGSGGVARTTDDAGARERLRALGYVTGSAAPKAVYTEADDPKRLVAVDQQLRHAVEFYEQRRVADAIPIYRQLIAQHPTLEIAYEELAMIQWDAGQPQEAIATLRAAVQSGAGSVTIQSKLGVYLAESGDVKEAIPLLQQTVAQPDPDIDALNALGIALGRSGRAAEARQVFKRIIDLNPGNTMALENLGSLALGEGQMEVARSFFTEALSGDASSSQANNGLGVVELKAGNRRAAIEHFRRAVDADPGNYDALYNAATELVNDGRASEARPYLERFAQTAPAAFYGKDIQYVRSLLARVAK